LTGNGKGKVCSLGGEERSSMGKKKEKQVKEEEDGRQR